MLYFSHEYFINNARVQLPESHVRPGYEILAISPGQTRHVLLYAHALAWSSSGPMAGFYFGVDSWAP
jgi:hypothetical protein